MIISKHSLNIELNNSRYFISLAMMPEKIKLDKGITVTFYIRSINNYKVSSESFFRKLKGLLPRSIFSIYSDDRRFIAEHINSHLHINFGNPYSIRDNATFVIEWQVRIVGEM